MSDLEVEESLPYKKLLQIYSDNFSFGHLGTDFKSKMALISLICHLTHQLKLKKPDITHYQILAKMAEGKGLPEKFIKGIAVVCDDFGYGCTEFPTFELKGQDIIKTIKNILDNYKPF